VLEDKLPIFQEGFHHESWNIFSMHQAYLETGDQHFITLLWNKVSWTAVEIWTMNTMYRQVSYAIQLPRWDQTFEIWSIASHTCSHSWTLNFVNVNILDRPALCSNDQSFWLLNMRSQVWFPVLTWGLFLGEDSHGDHGLGSLVELMFKAPPGTSYSYITIHLIGTT
jgi:hypothetical protein